MKISKLRIGHMFLLAATVLIHNANAAEQISLEISNSLNSFQEKASEEVKEGRANLPWANDNYALDVSYVENSTFLVIMQDKVKKIRTSVLAHNSAIKDSSITQNSDGETKLTIQKSKAPKKPRLQITRLEVGSTPDLFLACVLSHSEFKDGALVLDKRILANFKKLHGEKIMQLNSENDQFSYSITVNRESEKLYLELSNKNSGVIAKFESIESAIQPGVLMAVTEGDRHADGLFLVLNCAIKDNVNGLMF